MDVIVEVASFVINFALFLLLASSIIWLHFRPLITSYRLSPEGIDIMLLSVYKPHHISFRDITYIRVGGYISELMFPSFREFRRRKMELDKFYPKQVMIITTTNEKITHWILSTPHLDYIRKYTNIDT